MLYALSFTPSRFHIGQGDSDDDDDNDKKSMASMSHCPSSRALGEPTTTPQCPFTIFYIAEGEAQLLNLSLRNHCVKKAITLPSNPARDWEIRASSQGYYVFSAKLKMTRWVS